MGTCLCYIADEGAEDCVDKRWALQADLRAAMCSSCSPWRADQAACMLIWGWAGAAQLLQLLAGQKPALCTADAVLSISYSAIVLACMASVL